MLDRYRLRRRLGAGAFGTVWVGHDERLEREVAIKIIPRERIIDGRFEREARAAARLAHPGIVTLYEAAVDDDDAYLVSELVRGSTLDDLLDAGRLSDRDIVAIGIAMCDALAHAHEQGVIHRDVKPSNVLVPAGPRSSSQVAKLTDFGVARVVGGDSLTRTGDVLGTVGYMSPEQAEGLLAGPPADLYSLALVLYEALTGVNPIRMSTAAHRARRLGAHVPPLRRQRRDLPHELGQGIDLALRPKPRERGTIEDLRRALAATLEHVEDAPGLVASPWPQRAATGQPQPPSDEVPQTDPPPEPWPARAAGATATALLAACLCSHLVSTAAIAPAGAALLAATLSLALPRIAWGVLTAALALGLSLQHHAGAALLVAAAAAVPVALLPRSPTRWPLAAGAPALGALALAGAWPAIAARASGFWRRAGLGAIAWIWLISAEVLTGSSLYTRTPPGAGKPAMWTSSLFDVTHHVLVPIATGGLLAPAVVWALAAGTLPYLVRGRSLARSFVLVTTWAATVAAATERLVHAAGPHLARPNLVVIGAIASAALPLGPAALRKWQQSGRSAVPAGGLA